MQCVYELQPRPWNLQLWMLVNILETSHRFSSQPSTSRHPMPKAFHTCWGIGMPCWSKLWQKFFAKCRQNVGNMSANTCNNFLSVPNRKIGILMHFTIGKSFEVGVLCCISGCDWYYKNVYSIFSKGILISRYVCSRLFQREAWALNPQCCPRRCSVTMFLQVSASFCQETFWLTSTSWSCPFMPLPHQAQSPRYLGLGLTGNHQSRPGIHRPAMLERPVLIMLLLPLLDLRSTWTYFVQEI